MKSSTFRIEGMHCGGCAATIEALLQHADGVKRVAASFEKGEARILYDPALATADGLARVIEKAGYRITGVST